jgi:hypothetical protein
MGQWDDFMLQEVKVMRLIQRSWRRLILAVFLLAGIGGLLGTAARAEEHGGAPPDVGGAARSSEVPAPDAEEEKWLSISVSNDWVSKYMFRGFDVLDDRGAWQPSVDLEFGDTGLHFNWWASMALTSRGDEDAVFDSYPSRDFDEFDYTLYYTRSFCDEFFETETGIIYYDTFGFPKDDLDFWDAYGKVTLAKLPLSPHADFYYSWPVHRSVGWEGWSTCLGVSHTVELGCLPVFSQDPMELALSADIWYNGGSLVPGVETGWTHAVFGGSLTIPLPHGLSLSPGVWYQESMEDTINPENEWWTTVSLAYEW